jgi:hypothetical protein
VDVITKSPPSQNSPLMSHIQSPVILDQLMQHVFMGSDTSFVEGVRVIIALLQRSVQFEVDYPDTDGVWDLSPVMDAIVSRLPDLKRMLTSVPTNELKTSYGSLKLPLGDIRLRAVEMTCNLVQFDYTHLQTKMKELMLLPILLDLFFDFPWHNILQNLVESAIQIIVGADEGKVLLFRQSVFLSYLLLSHSIAFR